MNYKSFNLGDWIGHISGIIEDESTLDGNEMRDLVWFLTTLKQESTGHWIIHEEQFNALGIAVKGGVKCSECGYTTHNKLHMDIGCPYKYCPNCGAKMEVTK